MDTAEILKKVRRIEIKTRHMSQDLFSGSYHSAFKGRGMSFSEVRDYQFGDDVRNIDWNVTARMSEPHVKVFEEERELTVVLLIDMSASSFFGTNASLRSEMMTEIAAVISFAADRNNDKIGAIFFTEQIEQYIAPRKGRKHVLKLIRELVSPSVKGNSTNMTEAIQYLNNVLKKRAIVFILSDFLDPDYADALSILSRRHDTIGLRILDKMERELPKAGLIRAWDREKGDYKVINSSSRAVQKKHAQWTQERDAYFERAFNKCSADRVDLTIGEAYLVKLVQLFKKRAK